MVRTTLAIIIGICGMVLSMLCTIVSGLITVPGASLWVVCHIVIVARMLLVACAIMQYHRLFPHSRI